MWLVAGDTFGRRAASGFAAGAVSRVAKLAEGRLSSSPLFSPVSQILYWSQTESSKWSLDCLSSQAGQPRSLFL